MQLLSKDKKRKLLSSHWKRYGFINQNSEIYQGFAKTWDLGHNGTELKRKLKELWWKFFITSNPHNMSCETSILTPGGVLEASGHKKNFNDWVVLCKECKKKIRLDNIISSEDFGKFLALSREEKRSYKLSEKCECEGDLSHPQEFNLMIKADILTSKLGNEEVYLRPETCQGIFVNFPLIKNSTTRKLPFGIGQIGKSFRNEVTLNHGIFRTREFEQAELEFFTLEEKDKWWDYWNSKSWNFFQRIINDNNQLVRKIHINEKELPHYSLKTTDFHFLYSFGWGEVCSLSDRGDYDLRNHSQKSGSFLGIKDNEGKNEYPHVIETSFGIERLLLAILESSYQEEKLEESKTSRTRIYLKTNPLLSPFFASVMPLSKQLVRKAKELYLDIIKTGEFSISYEETGNIGNRYRRQDAIGTFFCVTVDFETENDNCVTVRERDSMQQERIRISELSSHLADKLKHFWKIFLG